MDLLAATAGTTPFLYGCFALAIAMLVWNTIEVGRNDAANLVNAVFGARVLRRRTAVWIAGLGVVAGACASSPVMETARKGIFDPAAFDLTQAVTVYVSVYIVDTVLLYGYSAFGMPVSTTACLVFALLGASFALSIGQLGMDDVVKWDKARTVILAIICSIIVSSVAGYLLQRIIRGAIRDHGTDLRTLLRHGPWAIGGLLAGLSFFMLTKGMTNVAFVQTFKEDMASAYGPYAPLIEAGAMWIIFAILLYLVLLVLREKAARVLLSVVAVFGMICMGFAFGQNDLANCASPGLAAAHLIRHQGASTEFATGLPIPAWMLLGCGFLLLVGMMSQNAQRVTRAEVNAGSMSNQVALWAPRWCLVIARMLLAYRKPTRALAPPASLTETGKKMHYDALRACVILGVSASVIATASSFGLPVSTTYVAFAAVIATGTADRILQRGDADLKLARTIWVVFSWFASAAIAAVAAGAVCLIVYNVGLVGIVLTLGVNLGLRLYLKGRADAQDARVREQSRDRRFPERYAEAEE
jgi:phosphate/sulfate permease